VEGRFAGAPQPVVEHPDRPVLALVGDGAMQMNGINELITVVDRSRTWADPRFVVLVLRNDDRNEVAWEEPESEGDPASTQLRTCPPSTTPATPAF
jgi:pyruvate dehydrogenase (quinone)